MLLPTKFTHSIMNILLEYESRTFFLMTKTTLIDVVGVARRDVMNNKMSIDFTHFSILVSLDY